MTFKVYHHVEQIFAVVEFTDAKFNGQCDVIPFNWISEDQKTCNWPPKGVDEKQAKWEQTEPGNNWTQLNVKVTFVCGKF
jgi:hypothetical protein